jgi:hypothetical protein
MDLTPAMGKLYLARVNPLLGEIVGPAIGEEDLPDVTVYVAPADFVLPADEYSIRIEPLRAVRRHTNIMLAEDEYQVDWIKVWLKRSLSLKSEEHEPPAIALSVMILYLCEGCKVSSVQNMREVHF